MDQEERREGVLADDFDVIVDGEEVGTLELRATESGGYLAAFEEHVIFAPDMDSAMKDAREFLLSMYPRKSVELHT